ncbi:MAG TPA: pitrilysin family protein [Terriglobales bacterium]|nr:pitrilysin family protein [Terriglobales bacterium]
MKRCWVYLGLMLALLGPWPLAAQSPAPAAQSSMGAINLAEYEKHVSVKTLPNGLTVVLWRRPEAPVFSFFALVDTGSAQDPLHATGLAHMMEHMAFKGTPDIGTTDYAAEKVALEKVEQAYAAYETERVRQMRAVPDPTGEQQNAAADQQKLKQLQQDWQQAVKDADQYVIKNQFGKVVEEHGGVGMNAFTDYDETAYMYSMPVNQIELWAALESDRLTHPVMREFYKERNVVMEERRMRTDSNPTGRLLEQFLGTSFMANPYHRPTIGYQSDLESFSATDAEEFFHRYYVPSNMVIGLVGDLDPDKVFPILERYFGQIPSRPKPLENTTVEPPQNSVREVTMPDPSQPLYLEGYHRPSYRAPDDVVYDAISDILSNGRTSRLYRSLVRDKQIAAAAAGISSYPGNKYSHIFTFYAVPTPGHTIAEIQKAFTEEIHKLKTQDVTDDELRMFKTRTEADVIRGLASNEGLAEQLAIYQTRYGDWRELFRYLDRVDKVTKADIRRVANEAFQDTNRTVGIIETKAESAQPAAPAGKGGAQ